MGPHRLTDAELLRGDDPHGDLFAAFYRRHARWLLEQLARQGADAPTAADVLAETFLSALVGRTGFDPARGAARAWLAGIARHKLLDDRRRSGRVRRLADRLRVELPAVTENDATAYDELQRGLAGDALGDVDDERVATAIGRLPHTQRRAVAARVVEERSYADVARALQTTEVSARKHVSRGLTALRRMLTD